MGLPCGIDPTTYRIMHGRFNTANDDNNDDYGGDDDDNNNNNNKKKNSM